MLKVSRSYGSSVCAASRTPRTIAKRKPGYSSTFTRLMGLSASSTASGWNAKTLSSIATHCRLPRRMSTLEGAHDATFAPGLRALAKLGGEAGDVLRFEGEATERIAAQRVEPG